MGERKALKGRGQELNNQVEKFNQLYPVGTKVVLLKDTGDFETEVSEEAMVLNNQMAVAWFKGVSGCYAIAGRVRPVPSIPPEEERKALGRGIPNPKLGGTGLNSLIPVATPKDRVVLSVPIPPSVNAIWRSRCIPSGRYDSKGRPVYFASIYMTDEGKEWLNAAVTFLKAENSIRFGDGEKVVVEARAFWPDARARDMNNLAKITCDALQHSGVVTNDKNILWREMDFTIDRENPRVMLEIYALDVKP